MTPTQEVPHTQVQLPRVAGGCEQSEKGFCQACHPSIGSQKGWAGRDLKGSSGSYSLPWQGSSSNLVMSSCPKQEPKFLTWNRKFVCVGKSNLPGANQNIKTTFY